MIVLGDASGYDDGLDVVDGSLVGSYNSKGEMFVELNKRIQKVLVR